jgi:hypothetical protein
LVAMGQSSKETPTPRRYRRHRLLLPKLLIPLLVCLWLKRLQRVESIVTCVHRRQPPQKSHDPKIAGISPMPPAPVKVVSSESRVHGVPNPESMVFQVQSPW